MNREVAKQRSESKPLDAAAAESTATDLPARLTSEPAMSPTMLALVARHGGPLARLEVIAAEYFGLTYPEAARRAALNLLPVPVFKLRDSIRAPALVRVADLANHIDQQAEAASKEWEKSQV